ncbi:uncharacterized protein LOC105846022 [Hydra vulgaris]|uniref:uncharacterized protein LOC105846022 n=1 Tax=Hydra vulgaris TaxID=6087 RepID=UPI0032EA38D4
MIELGTPRSPNGLVTEHRGSAFNQEVRASFLTMTRNMSKARFEPGSPAYKAYNLTTAPRTHNIWHNFFVNQEARFDQFRKLKCLNREKAETPTKSFEVNDSEEEADNYKNLCS